MGVTVHTPYWQKSLFLSNRFRVTTRVFLSKVSWRTPTVDFAAMSSDSEEDQLPRNGAGSRHVNVHVRPRTDSSTSSATSSSSSRNEEFLNLGSGPTGPLASQQTPGLPVMQPVLPPMLPLYPGHSAGALPPGTKLLMG